MAMDASRLRTALARINAPDERAAEVRLVEDDYTALEGPSRDELEALCQAAAAHGSGEFRMSVEQYSELGVAYFLRGLRYGSDKEALTKMIEAVKPGTPYDAAFWEDPPQSKQKSLSSW
jgi:hypothetical protein